MKNEIWKDIPLESFGERYQVSNLGRVKDKKREIIKLGATQKSGYTLVNLSAKYHSAMFSLHTLVAITFHGEPIGDRNQVNHKNCIKSDNRADNLEWVTAKENNKHARDNGLIPPATPATYGESSRRKMSEGGKRSAERWKNPENRARHSEIITNKFTDPEYRKKHKESLSTPEYKAKWKATTLTPEFQSMKRKLTKKQFSNPEIKERHREAVKLWHFKRKHTPSIMTQFLVPEVLHNYKLVRL